MNGILLIDKPPHITSAEVVRRIKRLVKPSRVGHLGTLDPFATGLLPILIGEGTKLAQFLDQGDKHYQGVMALGTETDTCDPQGEIVRRAEVPRLDEDLLAAVARRFTGEFEQVPPIFSAIKREGVPLYRLARRGVQVAPPAARRVRVERLELRRRNDHELEFSAVCSPGTYLRSLARDIGLALGSASHLAELRRLKSGGFSIEQAHPLTAITENQGELARALIGLNDATSRMAQMEVDGADLRRLRNGDTSTLLQLVRLNPGLFKIVCEGSLVAVARSDSEQGLKLLRVFAD
jgi:tRNA pseudouridine55 synthase